MVNDQIVTQTVQRMPSCLGYQCVFEGLVHVQCSEMLMTKEVKMTVFLPFVSCSQIANSVPLKHRLPGQKDLFDHSLSCWNIHST